MSAVIPFDYDGAAVRVVDRSGVPWFVLADVCRVLGIANARDAAARLDDEERDGVGIADAIGREQQSTIVNESGLYSLILRSRRPEAKRFKSWVTGTVLPSIRRHGGYITGQERVGTGGMSDAELLAQAAQVAMRVIAEREQRIAALEPLALAADRLGAAEGTMNITTAAKLLKVQPKSLFAWLDSHGWTYRKHDDGPRLAYQTKIDAGLMEHRAVAYTGRSGERHATHQPMVTPAGLVRLARAFAAETAARAA